MVDVSDIPAARQEEYNQLVRLLLDGAAEPDNASTYRAEWIARAALEPGHLWRAMRLNSRDELKQLLRQYFPEIYAANDKDMRWKKFLYKRMYGWSGFSA